MAVAKPKLTPKQALIKLGAFCAYQERCHNEVIDKLGEYGVWGDDANEVLLKLIELNYVNEERFAKAFAGGKFRTKQWGRTKIIRELKLRNISTYCINKGLAEIDDEDYLHTLKSILAKKSSMLKERNTILKNKKLAYFAISKGFEPDLVWDTVLSLE